MAAVTSCARVTDAAFPFEPDPYIFNSTDISTRLHSRVPRWGQTSNVTVVLLDEVNASESRYWSGVSASATLTVLLILVWSLGLLLYRVHRRRASLSTSSLSNEHATHIHLSVGEPEAPLESSTVPTEAIRSRRWYLVTAVAVAGLVVCTLLLYSLGVAQSYRASETVTNAIRDGQALTQQGIALLDVYTSRHDASWNQTCQYLQTTNELCPTLIPQLCNDTSNMETCDGNMTDNDRNNNSPIPSVLWNPWYAVLNATSALLQWDAALTTTLQRARGDLVRLGRQLDAAAATSESVTWLFHGVTIVSTMLLVWTMVLVGWEASHWPLGTGTASFPPFQRIRQWSRCQTPRTTRTTGWILWSIFGVLVALTLILSVTCLVAGIVVADGCMDRPDERVILLLDKLGTTARLDPLLNDFLEFYIRGCPHSDLPYHSVVVPLRRVAQATASIQTLLAIVSPTAGETTPGLGELLWNGLFGSDEGGTGATDLVWQTVCGTDATIFRETSMAIQETFCTLGDALVDIQNFFACTTFRPVYRQLVYEGICYQSNSGLYYMAMMQALVVVFAMILFTLRVALYHPPLRDSEALDRPFHDREIMDTLEVGRDTKGPDESGDDRGAVSTCQSETMSWDAAKVPQSTFAVSATPTADDTDDNVDGDIVEATASRDGVGTLERSEMQSNIPIRSSSVDMDHAANDDEQIQAAKSYP